MKSYDIVCKRLYIEVLPNGKDGARLNVYHRLTENEKPTELLRFLDFDELTHKELHRLARELRHAAEILEEGR